MDYAGFWKRFLASSIDGLIFYPLYVLNNLIFKSVDREIFLYISLLITTLSLLYNVLFIYFIGRTPGKIILKLKVVKTNGNEVGLSNALLRESFSIAKLIIWTIEQFAVFGKLPYISFTFTLISLIDYIVYIFNYRCKTIHDYIADTIVIDERVNKKRPKKVWYEIIRG